MRNSRSTPGVFSVPKMRLTKTSKSLIATRVEASLIVSGMWSNCWHDFRSSALSRPFSSSSRRYRTNHSSSWGSQNSRDLAPITIFSRSFAHTDQTANFRCCIGTIQSSVMTTKWKSRFSLRGSANSYTIIRKGSRHTSSTSATWKPLKASKYPDNLIY